MNLGVMQGRLSPPEADRIQCFPRTTWEREIERAPDAGLQAIEWICDGYGEGYNPIETDAGIARVRELSIASGIAVESICADCFMEEALIGGDEATRLAARRRLQWLLGRARLLGVGRIVLPFVDASALSDDRRTAQAVEAIEGALPTAREAGIELHLETSLGPSDFAAFLERVPDPAVRVNYDIGNSSSLGYDPHNELGAYGARLGSVHIKDRVHGGSTVALGTGDADFDAVVAELIRLEFRGPFVLQAARGEPGREVEHLREMAAFARGFLGGLPEPDRSRP